MTKLAGHHPRSPPRRDRRRRGAPAVAAGRVRGAGAGEGVAPDRDRRRQGPARDARPHPLLRPARAGQDHARHADGARDGRAAPHHLGPGAREAGRPGRAAHLARPGRHALHRRDPPAASRRSRSSSIPAMEDFRVDVRIADGPNAQTIPMALERFTLIGATTRFGLLTPPMRARFGWSSGSGFYPPEELQRIVTRSAAILQVPIDAGRRRRDRAAEPRHAAGRQPAAPPGARLRPGEGRRPDHRRRRRRGAGAAQRGRVRPRRHGRPDPHHHHREVRRRPGRARHRRRGGRRGRRHPARKSTSRTSSSRASSSARRAAAAPRRSPTAGSASRRPPAQAHDL